METFVNTIFKTETIKKFWAFYLFIAFVVFTLINMIIQSNIEDDKTYNFVITKIEVTPTRSLQVYDGNEKIDFWNFTIPKSARVEIGDLICKQKNSYFLIVKRKDNQGNYKEFTRFNHKFQPYEWKSLKN